MTPGLDDFLRRIGDVVGALQNAPGPVHKQIWSELGPWFRSVTINAVPKWLGQMAHRRPCHIVNRSEGQRCPRQSVVLCGICRNGTCLEHSFIDHMGDAICYACASKMSFAQAPRTPPRQPPRSMNSEVEAIIWARRQLKVKANATLDELRRAHRKLSAKYHPDMYRTADAKATAERKFKDIQTAFEILQKDAEKRTAA